MPYEETHIRPFYIDAPKMVRFGSLKMIMNISNMYIC